MMGSRTVLFVEDDSNLRTTLSTILKHKGFALTSVKSVTEALAAIGGQAFDILLSDLNIGEPGDLVDLVGELHKQGVQFKSLTDAIDTGTASGRFFFHVMASLAEMERELTIERTRAGLEIARQLGRKGGRKRQMTESKIKSARKLLASGVPPRDVASNLGVSVPTLYRWIPASIHP